MSQEVEIVSTKYGQRTVLMRGTIAGQYTRAEIMNQLRTGHAMLLPVQDGESNDAVSPRSAPPADTLVALRKRRGQKVQEVQA